MRSNRDQYTRPVRTWRTERGAELIELALTLPLLIFIVVGIVDFGFLFQRYEVVTNAAREGARVGVLPGYQDADIQARVNAYLAAAGLTQAPTLDISRSTATPVGGGAAFTVVQVRVDYPHRFVFLGPVALFFGGNFGTVALRGVSAMRAETAANPTP